VAHWADCAGVQVAVDLGPSCSKCMGPLVADTDVLDARFVGALWPLVSSGWPGDGNGPSERAPFTTLVVDGPAVTDWVLPMAALGVALTGSVPFCFVAVQPLHGLSALDASPPVDLDELLESGVAAARVAVAWSSIIGGRIDLDAARRLVAALADPPSGSGSVDNLVAAYDEAFASGCPAAALPALATALEAGVSRQAVGNLRSLATPFLGT